MSGQYFDVAAGTDRALTGAGGQRVNQLMADVFSPNKGKPRTGTNPSTASCCATNKFPSDLFVGDAPRLEALKTIIRAR